VDVVLRVLVLVLVGVLGAPAPPAAANDGPWGWPLAVAHEVSRAFAPPVSAYGAGHRGVDLPSVPGAPVRASAAGRITYAGLLAGRGVVVVTHGSLRTTYEPVAPTVRVGQLVALGEVVGGLSAGHAGCPAAACLHWGLRRGEEYLDPVRLVERGPVRLLPVDGARAAAAAPPPVIGAGVPPFRAPAEAGRRGPATAAASPPEAAEPGWSLRAAEAPLGAAAVVALVLGIGLLARPRPLPPGPMSGGVTAATAPPVDEQVGEPGALLDLDEARARRHAAS
jgi:hypothetical protein